MFDNFDPTVVYRAFAGNKNQITPARAGYRLTSVWFKSEKIGVSVYLGSETTLLQVCEKHPGQGVAKISLARLTGLGLELISDPRAEPGDLPGHRIILNGDRRIATLVTEAATIVVALAAFQVQGADGSVGVQPSAIPTAATDVGQLELGSILKPKLP